MDKKKFNISFFHVKPKRVTISNNLTDEDFAPAAEDEKSNMVAERASVSYWRDAARRFMANKVSVVALGVFLLVLLFTFVGPYIIPYNYSDQFRSSMKLAPFEYSETEQMIKDLLKSDDVDTVYTTSLQSGSLTSLKKGDYWFKYKGETYSVSFDSNFSDATIIVDRDAENVLRVVTDAELKSGNTTGTPLAYTTGAASDTASELKLTSTVFPHVFGTDSVGRDLMARCMYGGRVSLIIGIVAALIVLVIGAIYGSIAGLIGGKVDFFMMRIVDIIYSVPDVLIVLLLQVVLKDPLQLWFDGSDSSFVRALGDLGVGIVSIFITFALLYWVGMSRIIRGQVLQLKEQEYVTAANALGVPQSRIIKRHLLPNCVGQIVIATCLQIPSAIFLESFLSFLGLGVSAPMASLGSLCSDALDAITQYPYRLICPAIILTILVLSLNLVGDGLRDALDPKLKK